MVRDGRIDFFMPGSAVADNMASYYARRAAYYERVYFKPERQLDLRAIEAWLSGPFQARRVLEIACGTGWWTAHGARDARHWFATDLRDETLAVARHKAMPSTVTLGVLDAYDMRALGPRTFDAAFAGCWWSHVPLTRLQAWLDQLHSHLEPGSTVVFLDNSFVQNSNSPIHRRDADGNTYQWRELDDGTRHEVVKNFPTRDEAIAALGPRARSPQWTAYTHYWVLSYTLD